MDIGRAFDRVSDMQRKLSRLRDLRCPRCGSSAEFCLDGMGRVAWSCRACQVHGWGGGFLQQIEGETLVVDCGDWQPLADDLEALKAARAYVKRYAGERPDATSLRQLLWEIKQEAGVLRRWLSKEEVA